MEVNPWIPFEPRTDLLYDGAFNHCSIPLSVIAMGASAKRVPLINLLTFRIDVVLGRIPEEIAISRN
jgi:hypothetical protein